MAEEVKEEKKGGKGLIIALLVVVILLVVGIGVMAMMLLSSGNGDAAGQSVAPQTQEMQYSASFKQYPQPVAGTPPSYFEMKFVVNFRGEGKARFIGVDLKFMSRIPEVIADMEHIRPILQNDIQMLLRQQTYTELSQDDGQEVLRQRILEVGRAAAEDNGIFPDLVHNVFLTRFVMQ